MSNPLSQKPRVLQVITHLALGGAERVAFNLMHGLSKRYDFAVYAANGVHDDEVGRGMAAELTQLNAPLFVGTSVPIKRGGMLFAGHWFAKAIKQYQPQLIHLHTEIPESSYAAMVALQPWLKKIPVVRTIHNAIYWNPYRPLGRWCDAKMSRSFIVGVSKDSIVAFDELRRESKAGEPPLPPRVIYNGVAVKSSQAPQRDPSKLKLLFAGRFEDQKGVDLLPAVLAQVKPPKPAELTILGSGRHEALLRKLEQNPPSGWTVRIGPAIPNLSAHMPEYDLLLMPSRYEGLGLVVIEAALAGLPAIATDGVGIREALPPDYPFLAKAGDAASFAAQLQSALDHPEALPAALERAQRYAREHFDMAAMCDAYDALYKIALTPLPV